MLSQPLLRLISILLRLLLDYSLPRSFISRASSPTVSQILETVRTHGHYCSMSKHSQHSLRDALRSVTTIFLSTILLRIREHSCKFAYLEHSLFRNFRLAVHRLCIVHPSDTTDRCSRSSRSSPAARLATIISRITIRSFATATL